MKALLKLGVGYVAGALLLVGVARSVWAADSDPNKQPGVLSTLWIVSKADNTVTLLQPGKDKPVTASISTDTLLGGPCEDCNMFQPFKVSEAAKVCTNCACASANVICVAWKPLKSKTWDAMLQALPAGIGVHVFFNVADKPESGLKSLYLDRRTALLPVEGLNNLTPEQLLDLVKPVGGVKAELIDGGKLLKIDLKSDWTVDHETQLEKTLTKLGAKVATPSPVEVQK